MIPGKPPLFPKSFQIMVLHGILLICWGKSLDFSHLCAPCVGRIHIYSADYHVEILFFLSNAGT